MEKGRTVAVDVCGCVAVQYEEVEELVAEC